MNAYRVDPDITVAETLPGRFYHDAGVFEACRTKVFAHAWHWLGSGADVARPGSLAPRTLLPGWQDEPVLLARDAQGVLRCLSNVCTHRGNLLVTRACAARDIRCGYHSRRFDFGGRMTFMPEFKDARNFPRETDHLPVLDLATWGEFLFAAYQPQLPFETLFAPMLEATRALARSPAAAGASREYEVAANWALYVENYLEGFHVPYVHAALNAAIDYGTYRTRLYPWAVRQTAFARTGEAAFDRRALPDETAAVAADYWWVFPNLMFNFYPWGLSVNVVLPQAIDRTRVVFAGFVTDASQVGQGAGGALHQVEMEDEAIVEAVQRGTRSRFYGAGRYSPSRETGTHHFHRLLTDALA